jgi:hypothetical protein
VMLPVVDSIAACSKNPTHFPNGSEVDISVLVFSYTRPTNEPNEMQQTKAGRESGSAETTQTQTLDRNVKRLLPCFGPGG